MYLHWDGKLFLLCQIPSLNIGKGVNVVNIAPMGHRSAQKG